MKRTTFLIIISLISLNLLGQSKVDSLQVVTESLKKEKKEIEKKIEIAERAIVTDIVTNGYEITVKVSPYKEVLEVKDKTYNGTTIASLKNGDKLLIIGKKSIYHKVKVGDKIGYAFISGIEYPVSLVDNYKYSDIVSPSKENTSSSYKNTLKSSSSKSYKSSSKCYSTQCSGRTKKGARCKNKTTNCSGRCYRH